MATCLLKIVIGDGRYIKTLYGIAIIIHIPYKIGSSIGGVIITMIMSIFSMTLENNAISYTKVGTNKITGVYAGIVSRITITIDSPYCIVNRHISQISRIIHHTIARTIELVLNNRHYRFTWDFTLCL